jgi:HSP20 family molecular chaperone IbpA
MAKAILIDTDNLDLAKLGEVFGADVAEAIASAIGKEFKSSVDESALDEDDELEDDELEDDELEDDELEGGGCDCEDCSKSDEDESEDESEVEYGQCVTQDENEYRFKVAFNLPNTDVDAVSVAFTDEGFRVEASSLDGEEFEQVVVTTVEGEDKVLDRSNSSASLENGVLTIRVGKSNAGPKTGEEILVEAA